MRNSAPAHPPDDRPQRVLSPLAWRAVLGGFMIVVFYPQYHGVGGIARYLESFLANLPKGAPPVVLVTGGDARAGAGPAAPGGVGTEPQIETIHLPAPDNRWGLALWGWRARHCLATLERQRGPITAVNLHIPPLIPGLLLAARFPVVLTAHTTYVGMSGRFEGNRHFRSPWNALSLWLKTAMERHLIARARQVITLTEQGRQELALYGRHEGVHVIPNGVDTAVFTPAPAAAPGAQAAKDIDVLFCGRIEKRKGSRPMVEVCRRLVAAHPGIRIAIVGYGDDEAHVRGQLGVFPAQVQLTGKVPPEQMVGYYRRSRVYASTSYYEGLPGTCLEAMACGVPAVVWDRAFYRGLVVEGLTGRVVPTNDGAAMADAVAALLHAPEAAATLGRQARDLVRERYDWRRLAQQVLEVCTTRTPRAGLAPAVAQ